MKNINFRVYYISYGKNICYAEFTMSSSGVTVHTPLFREMFWHEYAKIPRHTSQNSIAARQSGMNFGYVTVNGVNSNEYFHNL